MIETRVHKVMDQLSVVNPFRGSEGIEAVPKVSSGVPSKRLPVAAQVAVVQRAIASLRYNFLPSTFFTLEKNRPLRNLLSTAQEILQESLPIRCLEATFLAVYLTTPVADVERFPVAFKSVCNGKAYRHIVLVVRQGAAYGALGLSRMPTLMDKPLGYASLLDLLDDYAEAYRAIGHELASIKLGLYFSRDPLSRTVPFWRFICTPVPRTADLATRAAAQAEDRAVLMVLHGRRRGELQRQLTPASVSDGEAPPRLSDDGAHQGNAQHRNGHHGSDLSYKRDPVFATLIDKFCEQLPALSEEYNNGGGDAVNAAMEALKNAQLAMQPVAALPGKPRGRTLERADDPARGAPRSAAGRLRGLVQGEAQAAAASANTSGAGDDDQDAAEDDDAQSDSEENTFRLNCVLQGVSPFKRLAQRGRAQSNGPGHRSSSVAAKLRGDVAAAARPVVQLA